MVELKLERRETLVDGTFGRLYLNGLLPLATCEEDWLGNKRNISAIPAGTYPLRRTIYYKHGYETFEVCNVPERSRILIHPGNTEEDTQGCILLGMRRGHLWVPDEDDPDHTDRWKHAVVESQDAFRLFMEHMRGVDEARITIDWNVQ